MSAWPLCHEGEAGQEEDEEGQEKGEEEGVEGTLLTETPSRIPNIDSEGNTERGRERGK